jgi:hypothetical protein
MHTSTDECIALEPAEDDMQIGVKSLMKSSHGAGPGKIAALQRVIDEKNQALLHHRYFRLCRARELTRKQTLEIVKQLYCFSVFFERLLTRRIAEYTSGKDERIIQIARRHLREEIGHAELFWQCLEANGVSRDELVRMTPKMFMKTMFGYLTAMIQHEGECVSNVVILQVLRNIRVGVSSMTLEVMRQHGLTAKAMEEHSEDDEEHAHIAVELAASFDERKFSDCRRVIGDLYQLMEFVLDEWLAVHDEPPSAAPERKRRSSRPPRSN